MSAARGARVLGKRFSDVDSAQPSGHAKTGIAGLDDITGGGLQRGRIFLLEGAPGTGKTTIRLQFLMAGAAEGERCLHVTLSETENELRAGAALTAGTSPASMCMNSRRRKASLTKNSSKHCFIPQISNSRNNTAADRRVRGR